MFGLIRSGNSPELSAGAGPGSCSRSAPADLARSVFSRMRWVGPSWPQATKMPRPIASPSPRRTSDSGSLPPPLKPRNKERSPANSDMVTAFSGPFLRCSIHSARSVTFNSAKSWTSSRMGPSSGLGTGVYSVLRSKPLAVMARSRPPEPGSRSGRGCP